MALPQWTDAQVYQQLNSGQTWSNPVITYTFPQLASQIHSSMFNGEGAGFTPLTASQQSLIHLGMAIWNDLIPSSIVPGAIGRSSIEFSNSTTGVEYAHAYYPNNGGVWFDADNEDLQYASVGSYGFDTFLHEIGHALGLEHMGDYNGNDDDGPSSYQDSMVLSIMSYYGPGIGRGKGLVAWGDWIGTDGNGYSPQTPMLNDVMAIQGMYGAAVTRADDTVYGFGSTARGDTALIYDFTVNLNPILTIYDSDGTDTLNFSGWGSDSDVDLRDGFYSSVNGMTNNIAIARGVTLENVITGAGDDSLHGNAADNILDGGAGQDAVYYDGRFDHYQIRYDLESRAYTVHDTTGADGTDTLLNIERAGFMDQGGDLNDLTPGVHRFFNADLGVHFFTASNDEATSVLDLAGFQYEGVAFGRSVDDPRGDPASAKGLVDVYRFFNASNGDHFLTADATEAAGLRAQGILLDEGTAFSAYGAQSQGTMALHRFYNQDNGAHFYTADADEMLAVSQIDSFLYEGVAFYVAAA